jgi:hypothetical protein
MPLTNSMEIKSKMAINGWSQFKWHLTSLKRNLLVVKGSSSPTCKANSSCTTSRCRQSILPLKSMEYRAVLWWKSSWESRDKTRAITTFKTSKFPCRMQVQQNLASNTKPSTANGACGIQNS